MNYRKENVYISLYLLCMLVQPLVQMIRGVQRHWVGQNVGGGRQKVLSFLEVRDPKVFCSKKGEKTLWSKKIG